jgi:hypothetical protein
MEESDMSATKRTGISQTSDNLPKAGIRDAHEGLRAAAVVRVPNLLGDFSEQTGAQFG